MNLWQLLLSRLGLRPDSETRTYELDENLHLALEDLASREQRPAGELAADLLASALAERSTAEDAWQRWQSLSPREQDAAALACLGYTNRQIAALLGVSAETVKTHLHNALIKLGVRGRAELRRLLEGWDFSAWDATADEHG
jgi:DNA-binding CsgD family transcriptional regulator